MNRMQRAELFVQALRRQVANKKHLADGVETRQDPLKLIASIAEELGEVSTDYVRGRYWGTVAECIDVAHSALLLALELDCDGEILKRMYLGQVVDLPQEPQR